jgi:hypothetical protein
LTGLEEIFSGMGLRRQEMAIVLSTEKECRDPKSLVALEF